LRKLSNIIGMTCFLLENEQTHSGKNRFANEINKLIILMFVIFK
jgi:hypothetical protein